MNPYNHNPFALDNKRIRNERDAHRALQIEAGLSVPAEGVAELQDNLISLGNGNYLVAAIESEA